MTTLSRNYFRVVVTVDYRTCDVFSTDRMVDAIAAVDVLTRLRPDAVVWVYADELTRATLFATSRLWTVYIPAAFWGAA